MNEKVIVIMLVGFIMNRPESESITYYKLQSRQAERERER